MAEDEFLEIGLSEAQVMRKNAEVGETIEVHQKVESFGRVAAQTAKQVILQSFRKIDNNYW